MQSEWESLQVTEHRSVLENIEDIVCAMHVFPEDIYTAQKPPAVQQATME